MDAGHLLAAFDSLGIGFGLYTLPSTHSAAGKRFLLSAREESMNSKCSGSDSKRWRSQSSVMLSLADSIQWDLTLLSGAQTGYGLSVRYLTWAVASAYLFYDLLCACLKCNGPNVVLLHSSVPVLLYYLPLWGFSKCFCNASRCITYHLQVASTYKWPCGAHVELRESAGCKFMARHV